MTLRLQLLLVLAVLTGMLLPAGENAPGVVRGVVSDEAGRPVPGAVIKLDGGGWQAVTGADGRFEMTWTGGGPGVLTITARGFFSGSRIELGADVSESELQIRLQRESVLEQSVVVTGSGNQALLVEAPVRTELLPRSFVEQQTARNVAEALTASVPGVRIENNCQNCGWTAIRMNGLEGPYTQILEDGLPTVSGASMVYALDQLPTNFFENIEVVKGGASALYGPNAVAGVINLVRREPDRNRFQADLQGGVSRGRPEYSGGLVGQLSEFWKSWSADFYYRGLHRVHNDLDRDGFTELTRRSSNGWGGTVFRRFLEGKGRFTAGASAIDDFRRGGSQLDLPPEQTYITEQVRSRRTALFGRWNHTVNPEFYYNLSTSLSYLKRDSYYGAGFDPNAYGDTRNPLSTTDASAGWQAGRHTLSSGFQFWHERIEDVYPGYERDTRQTFRNSGFYVQDEWRVNSRLAVLGGVRMDKSNLLNHWILSPRGNVRVGLTPSLSFRAGFSTGFRPPQIFDEDLHIAAVGGEAMLVRYAQGLRAESSRSLTSALDYVGRVGGRPLQLGASFFWTSLRDVFQLVETDQEMGGNRVFERTNGPGSRFRGVEFHGRWQLRRGLSMRGGGSFQQSRYQVPEPVFGSLRYFRNPNRYGYAGLDMDLPGGIELLQTLDLTGSMLVPHYAGFIPEDRLERSRTFQVWSFVLAKTIPLGSADERRMRIYLRGNNLTNSFQRDFDQGPDRDSTYIYGPVAPRGLLAGVTVSF